MYIRWLIFSCDLLSLYPAVDFLSMSLSGIMAIMIVHLLEIYLFGSLFQLSFFLPLSIPTLQVFMVFSMKFMTYFVYFEAVYYPALRDHVICLFVVNLGYSKIFLSGPCSHLGCVDLCRVTLMCLWILCGILSDPQGTICDLLASSKSLTLFVLLISCTSSACRL